MRTSNCWAAEGMHAATANKQITNAANPSMLNPPCRFLVVTGLIQYMSRFDVESLNTIVF
jgi:hypothetical protein